MYPPTVCLPARDGASPRKTHMTAFWCRSNNSAVARNEAPPNITPIANLNAYHSRWTIRARVTSKSEMRRFSNARGEGAYRRLHGTLGSSLQHCLVMTSMRLLLACS